MVLAISFLEAPLEFCAPGVTFALGLGIGRIVFAALNRAEVVLALAILLADSDHPSGWSWPVPWRLLRSSPSSFWCAVPRAPLEPGAER